MQSFIIRLKEVRLSRILSKECIAQGKKFGLKIEEFDAVNGLDYKVHFDENNLRPYKKFKKFRAGVFGCFLSHYYLWQHCCFINKPLLILEHDGYLIKPLPKNICDQFEDVLKLDSEDPYSKNYEKTISNNENNPLVISEIDHNENIRAEAGYYSMGAYAYIIKPHAAKKLLDWVRENGFLPVDWLIASEIIKVQTVRPTIVRLHPYYFQEVGNIKSQSMTFNEHLLVGERKI